MSSDRRAAGLLAAVAVAGLIVRVVTTGAGAAGAVAFRPASVDSVTRDSLAAAAVRLARPLGPADTVDVDRASAQELARLPRIGPALAARIVADRDARGPFGSLEGLRRVPGIGPATAEGLRPHARFSGRPRAGTPGGGTTERVAVNRASVDELQALPGIGPALARAIVEERRRSGPFRNPDDLRRVPGIGPVLVTRLTPRIRIP